MDENQTPDQETAEVQDNAIKKAWIELVSAFFNGENMAAIVKAWQDVKTREIETASVTQVGLRKFWRFKTVFEIIALAVVLAAIGFLGYFKIIDGSTTGTLLASVIGYTIGRGSKN